MWETKKKVFIGCENYFFEYFYPVKPYKIIML
jgi:hypothetical protein